MILRCSFLFSLFFFLSCSKTEVRGIEEFTFFKNLSISSYDLGKIKWRLNCRYADFNEDNNIKCLNAHILIYLDEKLSSEMSSEKAYADIVKKSFYLEKNAKVRSYSEDLLLVTEKIFFDYQTENIYSDTETFIYKKDVKIISQGFQAKSDLSNIKIKKHLTQISPQL